MDRERNAWNECLGICWGLLSPVNSLNPCHYRDHTMVLGGCHFLWNYCSLSTLPLWHNWQVESQLSAAEQITFKYVWERYDLLILPPSFPYGGMENPCLTFVTPTLLVGEGVSKLVPDFSNLLIIINPLTCCLRY